MQRLEQSACLEATPWLSVRASCCCTVGEHWSLGLPKWWSSDETVACFCRGAWPWVYVRTSRIHLITDLQQREGNGCGEGLPTTNVPGCGTSKHAADANSAVSTVHASMGYGTDRAFIFETIRGCMHARLIVCTYIPHVHAWRKAISGTQGYRCSGVTRSIIITSSSQLRCLQGSPRSKHIISKHGSVDAGPYIILQW